MKIEQSKNKDKTTVKISQKVKYVEDTSLQVPIQSQNVEFKQTGEIITMVKFNPNLIMVVKGLGD